MQCFLYIVLFLLKASFILGSTPVQLVCAVDNATCLIAEAKDMFGVLVGDYSRLHTDSLDTMFINYVHIDQDNYKIDLRDIQVNGLKNAVVEEVRVDITSKVLYLRFYSDFTFTSQYINKGTVLSMDIKGEGSTIMKFKNVLMELTMKFDLVRDAHDDDVMMLRTYIYTYDVRDSAEYTFDNLYYGNKTASDAMHKALNQNWKFLTIEFGNYLLDPVNTKIFNSIRVFAQARPLKEYLVY